MTGWRGAMLAPFMLAGCAAMQSASTDGSSAQRAGAVDSIGFELKSWGHPLEGFTIARDGSGEFRKAPRLRAEVQTTRFNAGREGFERIRTALQPVERFGAAELPCGQRLTDLPYGEIVWQRGESRTAVRIDVGCRSAEMQAVVARAQQATTLAEGFARANATP